MVDQLAVLSSIVYLAPTYALRIGFILFVLTCAAVLPASALVYPVETEVSIESWSPAMGDKLIVDTDTNEAFLVHRNGKFVRFPVATGQRRYVRYIGRSYFAATPNREWTVESKEYKGRSATFGEEGLFLRLYYEGERTPYGIHAYLGDRLHDDPENMYRSMGCIVPTHEMLDLLRQTFDINEGTISVITKPGIDIELEIADQIVKK